MAKSKEMRVRGFTLRHPGGMLYREVHTNERSAWGMCVRNWGCYGLARQNEFIREREAAGYEVVAVEVVVVTHAPEGEANGK